MNKYIVFNMTTASKYVSEEEVQKLQDLHDEIIGLKEAKGENTDSIAVIPQGSFLYDLCKSYVEILKKTKEEMKSAWQITDN